MANENDVTLDQFILGGTALPPSGSGNRYTMTFGPSFQFDPSNSGAIASRLPRGPGTVVVSTFPTEATHRLLLTIFAAQEVPGSLPLSGAGVLNSSGEAINLSNCRITQRPAANSERTPSVVTWTIGFSGWNSTVQAGA